MQTGLIALVAQVYLQGFQAAAADIWKAGLDQ
jgi:hypothetical protein